MSGDDLHHKVDEASGAHGDWAKNADAPSDVARRILRLRRKREAVLDAALFADPAWDILLDLLVADADGRTVSVGDVCLAAAVPATTGLRWLQALAERGYVQISRHDYDGRRRVVCLAPEARSRLNALLEDL